MVHGQETNALLTHCDAWVGVGSLNQLFALMSDHPVRINLSGSLGIQVDHLELSEVCSTYCIVLRAHVQNIRDAVIVKVVSAGVSSSIAYTVNTWTPMTLFKPAMHLFPRDWKLFFFMASNLSLTILQQQWVWEFPPSLAEEKTEWGENPKPPKTVDFTLLPSLLRKISLLFMWWQLPLILETVWSLLEPDCRPRRPTTNKRSNRQLSGIVFSYSQGAYMCLLSNRYLTQLGDNKLVFVQALWVLCKSFFFFLLQLCKCQVTLILQSSVR